jgi:1-deoxy-D-xylulose-5-phosphate synthase
VVEALRSASRVGGPVLVHVVTQKGRGYDPADQDRERAHAVSAVAAKVEGAPPPPPRYQDVFAETLIDLARTDDKIIGITAAMPSGTSLGKFQQAFPDRFFDVGIAEQHAVTFAAGLATQGMKPVCAIYSTFLQRAYDQIIHDVCIQRLPVVFAMDRAGFAGDDGRTHHGVFDLSYLRCLPNMVIMAPKNECELRHMIKTAIEYQDGPIAVRYPRGAGVGCDMSEPAHTLPTGRAELLRQGSRIALVGIGSMVYPALGAADLLMNEGIEATVVNARFAKPLDEALLLELADTHDAIITLEENVTDGGFGSGVLELYAAHDKRVPIRIIGIPDHFFEQASQARLRELCGLTPHEICAAAKKMLPATNPANASAVPV